MQRISAAELKSDSPLHGRTIWSWAVLPGRQNCRVAVADWPTRLTSSGKWFQVSLSLKTIFDNISEILPQQGSGPGAKTREKTTAWKSPRKRRKYENIKIGGYWEEIWILGSNQARRVASVLCTGCARGYRVLFTKMFCIIYTMSSHVVCVSMVWIFQHTRSTNSY